MTRDEIYETVKEILVEALGADDDEVTPKATLTGDLEAESIDFLDIVFRLEKAFSTGGKPFKISQGELFPENLLENADWVANGKFTDAGMIVLRERMPHIDFDEYDSDRDVTKVAELITVDSLVTFVERKLAA
ncbi:MAG: acyl carrier protein [Planctomycetota bacterium]|jgi:acyl carrier protein